MIGNSDLSWACRICLPTLPSTPIRAATAFWGADSEGDIGGRHTTGIVLRNTTDSVTARDDARDEDEDEEDEEDEEEEEHLAPADSTVIPADEPVFPPEGTEPVIPPPVHDITVWGW
ncbi:hypothetical protein Tco_1440305 [Tanacetum coccineum]